MPREDEWFPTSDGLRLGEHRWLPDREARAAMVLVHGLAEHSGRYAELAATLCGLGYAVHAVDLRGHGRSEGPRCLVLSFDEYLEDLDRFLGRVRTEYPGRPVFLFGHSMGGAVAGLLAVERQSDLRGLILSAPAVRVGDHIFPVLRRLAALMGRFFPRLRVVRLGSRALSRDPAVVEDFQNDPLVFHGRLPCRTAAEILRAMRRLRTQAAAIRTPLLVLHGTGDILTDPSGSREVHRQAASTDKTLALYDGLYHDLWHEPEKRQVTDDLVRWLREREG
jgi:acylglycerol lipase